MRKLAILLVVIGLVMLGMGAYTFIQLNANGYDSTTTSMLLALGREMGLQEDYSLMGKIKLWFAENQIMSMVIGVGAILLSFAAELAAKESEREESLRKATEAGHATWRCNECGACKNPAYLTTCKACGAVKSRQALRYHAAK